MSSRQIEYLLEELCVVLGFCLSPEQHARILEKPEVEIDAFTDAVIRAEGLDPYADIPTNLRRQVRAIVVKYFKASEDDLA
jgi:hypothetical protein